MNLSDKTLIGILILSLTGCSQTSELGAQPKATAPAVTSPARPDTTDGKQCRSLRRADAFAKSLSLSDPWVVILRSEIGQLEAKSGDLESANQLLELLNQEKESPFAGIAKTKIKVVLASVLASQNRMEDAEKIAEEIPAVNSEQRCVVFSEIAGVRAAKGDQETATRFWRRAEQSIANEPDAKKRSESERVVIRSLAAAGQLEEAKKRAAGMEAKYDDRTGWGPVAEYLALKGNTEAAEKIINSKLEGLNSELYLLIAAIAPKGLFIEGLAALGQMDDPALAATASHLMTAAMARRGNKAMALLQLKQSWSYMDIAKPDQAQSGRILLSSIDPMAILAGVEKTLVVCQAFEKKFPPNLAADAYCRLATYCRKDANEEQARYLDHAEGLSQKVRDVADQTTCMQEIFRNRSVLLGEDQALRAAEKVTGELNRGYAFLGVAKGQLLFSKK
jgi:hypothetical protein